MEQWEFFIREAINRPEIELKIRAVFAQNTALHEENAELKDELAVLKERVAWFEKQFYGQKSEKTEVVLENAEQLSLFDEAEQAADVNPKTLQTTEVKAHNRVKRTRDEIYADLPVEEVFHEVEDKTCDKCGAEMVVIGKEKIRDELVYNVPARMFLRRHIAEVVKCSSCGMDEAMDAALPDIEKCHILTAEVPSPMIPWRFEESLEVRCSRISS